MCLVAVLLLVTGCISRSGPPVAASELALEPLAAQFSQPLLVTSTDAYPNALFVVEKAGRIQVVIDGHLMDEPLLDLRGHVSGSFEQGLLGLAFHLNFASNGLFYVNFTDRSGATQVVRYHVEPGSWVANEASATTVLTIPQPAANHNGGGLAFGPDGYLYIATGDGGGAGDPHRNGQNASTLLGKMLRIDVDHGDPYSIPASNPFIGDASYRPEIWALGLRNPWRFSFDRLTGDLYIADVGQNAWEEVNRQPSSSTGGENYGWNLMEASHCYPANSTCNSSLFASPVIEYSHQATGGCSITGGYVYRGSEVPSLIGKYVFGDYCSGQIWVADIAQDGSRWEITPVIDSNLQISSFGEDAHGELYVTDLRGGRVYRIVGR